MKSKQDILKENYEKYFSVQKYDNSVTKATNEGWVCLALDDYAKEVAIDFAEYLSGNGYRQYDSRDRWINPEDTGNQVFTTKQLFEQYKIDKW